MMKITLDIPEHILSQLGDSLESRQTALESLARASIRPNLYWVHLLGSVASKARKWAELENIPLESVLGMLVKDGLESALVSGKYPISEESKRNLSIRYLMALFYPENSNYSFNPVELMMLSISTGITIDLLEEYLKLAKSRFNLAKSRLQTKHELLNTLMDLL